MGAAPSTLRMLAPLSFAFNFVAQQYGMFSTPNMLDVHNANPAAFSPQPYFIAGFFFPQQLFQLAWLWKLCRGAGTEQERNELEGLVWPYVVGNVCIGTWMFFWNANALATSNVFVALNTLTQLAYVAAVLPPLRTRSAASRLTHVVAKTFAGIGVLDLLHNTSAAYYGGVPPSGLVKVATGVGFAAAASASDWIFGACLVYDLVALAVGQGGSWGALLGAYAGVAAGTVGWRNWGKRV
ncbi:hypothetical protein PMIN06_003561 [Paraphaeosphaeria minitans]